MAKKQYFYALGRRKTATAQVKVFAGEGSSTINGRPMNEYLTRADLFSVIHAPAKVSGLDGKVHYEIEVSWSGPSAQAQAIRHGISRALVLQDAELKKSLKGAGFLTRDSRQVERKKPGLHKARKSPSWSKR